MAWTLGDTKILVSTFGGWVELFVICTHIWIPNINWFNDYNIAVYFIWWHCRKTLTWAWENGRFNISVRTYVTKHGQNTFATIIDFRLSWFSTSSKKKISMLDYRAWNQCSHSPTQFWINHKTYVLTLIQLYKLPLYLTDRLRNTKLSSAKDPDWFIRNSH